MNERELLLWLDSLGQPRVLIVGDLILDRYIQGDVVRISPEAPIPVLSARSTDERLGGAGNVAANLSAMGAAVEVLGVVGDDELGERLLGLLGQIGVSADGCPREPGRPTTGKTRLVCGGQQLVRIDWEENGPIAPAIEDALLADFQRRVGAVGAVVLSDYGKGVLTDRVLHTTIMSARAAGVPVLVDPKGNDYRRYRGATLVTPNRKEAEEAVGRKLPTFEDVAGAAVEIQALAELDCSVITLGADGIYFQGPDGAGRVPALARQVFDVTGAGDTVIGNLALAFAAGASLEHAVTLANHAAGICVARRGAWAVTRDEVRVALGHRSLHQRILVRDDVPAAVAEWRAQGKRVVFTNGCFDVLHAGHVEYLRMAKSRGDILIVGVNDDASVRRLKGEPRPINELSDRMTVLSALEMVDAVVPFTEDTPENIVQAVTPDVLVKGEDWAHKGVVGREWVEKHGGVVFLAPLLPGRSTSRIARELGLES
ncbi:MAG: D-glycero-beta-D-manno-heptose-7-phosphate kinase [Planctomycetota bacterium]